MNPIAQTLFHVVERLASGYRRHRRRVLTERVLNELPSSIRKDIGWPDNHMIGRH